MKKKFVKNAWTARPRRKPPSLRFTPTAWAKLTFLRDLGDTEVGGFGISSEEDLLLVEDVRLIKQTSGPLSVKFEDEAVADFFDTMVDEGFAPEQFARLWIHTHPGDSPEPSSIDEKTFRRCFGECDWSMMFILAQDDSTYARLRFTAGPGGSIHLLTQVAYDRMFSGTDHEAWEAEYQVNVGADPLAMGMIQSSLDGPIMYGPDSSDFSNREDVDLPDYSLFSEELWTKE